MTSPSPTTCPRSDSDSAPIPGLPGSFLTFRASVKKAPAQPAASANREQLFSGGVEFRFGTLPDRHSIVRRKCLLNRDLRPFASRRLGLPPSVVQRKPFCCNEMTAVTIFERLARAARGVNQVARKCLRGEHGERGGLMRGERTETNTIAAPERRSQRSRHEGKLNSVALRYLRWRKECAR
jgi:hypothetical protein